MGSSEGKSKESRFKEVNQRYQENANYAYMDKLEDNEPEDNKTDEGDEAIGNDDIVDFEFGNTNQNYMNQGEQNPEKVFKFNNNKHRLEDESIKPDDLKMKFSLNPLEKLQSTKTV